jgi:hypothetical protein
VGKMARGCPESLERIVGAQACCAHFGGRDQPSHEATAWQASSHPYEFPAESWFNRLSGQPLEIVAFGREPEEPVARRATLCDTACLDGKDDCPSAHPLVDRGDREVSNRR